MKNKNIVEYIKATAIMEGANKNRKGFSGWFAILFLRDYRNIC